MAERWPLIRRSDVLFRHGRAWTYGRLRWLLGALCLPRRTSRRRAEGMTLADSTRPTLFSVDDEQSIAVALLVSDDAAALVPVQLALHLYIRATAMSVAAAMAANVS